MKYEMFFAPIRNIIEHLIVCPYPCRCIIAIVEVDDWLIAYADADNELGFVASSQVCEYCKRMIPVPNVCSSYPGAIERIVKILELWQKERNQAVLESRQPVKPFIVESDFPESLIRDVVDETNLKRKKLVESN